MYSTLQLLKDFCKYDFEERNGEKALALLTDDIYWFGTSDHEDVHGIVEARKYISKELHDIPSPYKITIQDEHDMPAGADNGVAFLRMYMEAEGVRVLTRITAASRLVEGYLKICSMHFSTSDTDQLPDEFFPLTKGKEKIAREKIDLAMSTMPGGLIGVYVATGFPIYFINDRMLEFLGYPSEEEFYKAVASVVVNMIHPDDLPGLRREMQDQLDSSNYCRTEFRMRKYDGSYVWIHGIGQRTISERGEDVIIAVCYDVTKEHERQVQIDNLINTIPGGVAMYHWIDDDLKLIYQSQGVGRLTGRTADEYSDLVQGSAWDSIYTEDVDAVRKAFRKAAETDESVSMDYRINHINGETVWINGSFRKSGMDNGVPVIHAVFSEMPQMHELLMTITEQAGVGIEVSDSETHELLYLNPEILKIVGKTGENYQGKLCYNYLLGLDEPCPGCRHDQSADGNMRETYIPQVDSYFMVQERFIKWAGREAQVKYMTDVTATRKAQKKIDDMLANVSSGIIVGNMDPRDGSYSIEYMNKGFCDLLEGTEDVLKERYSQDLTYNIHPDDVDKAYGMAKKLAAGDIHADTVMRFLFPDGRIKWIHLDRNGIKRPDGTVDVYLTYNDITDERNTSQQLKASENALDVATDSAGLWYWRYDSANDRAYFGNRIAEEFNMDATSDNYPDSWFKKEVILPEYESVYRDALQRVSNGEPQVTFEAQGILSDGNSHWAEFRFTRLPEDEYSKGMVVCTARLIDYEKDLLAQYEIEKQKPDLGDKYLLYYAVFDINSGKTTEYAYAMTDEPLDDKFTTIDAAMNNAVNHAIGEEAKDGLRRLNSRAFLEDQIATGNMDFSMDYRRILPDGKII